MTKYLEKLLTVLITPDIVQCQSDSDHVDKLLTSNIELGNEELEVECTTCEIRDDFHVSSSTPLYKRSPFYVKANEILQRVKSRVVNPAPLAMANPRFNPKLAEKVVKFLVCYAPMLTSIMIGEHHDGWLDSVVECWQKILKHNILASKVELYAHEVVSTFHSTMHA